MTTSSQTAAVSRRPAGGFAAALGRTAALIGLVAGVLVGAAATSPAPAQQRIIFPGHMAVSGFPGTIIPNFDKGIPPGVDPVDETFIDESEASVRIFDATNVGGPPSGQLVITPPPFEVAARQVGQVFGLTYDDGKRLDTPEIIPNLYATATSLLGIQIVAPDADGDGRPERLRRGQANATFMTGQWGAELGGNAGSIYKIDGRTGAVTLFATIPNNSGAGLGDITFDRVNRQFFVSDIETGLVHRLSIDGLPLGTFDHGVSGRPARGLPPLADDPASVMKITDAAFDTENPATWGYTAPDRQVWGVAVQGRRLFYAVGMKAQVWSVGIRFDGSLANDARWELDVASDRDYAVTDIVFDRRGFMYLSQRGELQNRYDYSRFANTGQAKVLRYWREVPDNPLTPSVWVPVPQEYAVGFPTGFRQSTGGIDLQYDYDRRGVINLSACDQMLAKTGDNLRDNPLYAAQLAAGGPPNVHGVQLTDTVLVRPANEPPFQSYFFDYDGLYEDPFLQGHIGDVEVWRPCDGRVGERIPLPPPPNLPPCIDLTRVDFFCGIGGLYADIYVRERGGLNADTLAANSLTPGVTIAPPMQSRPSPDSPFNLQIGGALPGQNVLLGLCLHRGADAQRGGYFPCCQVKLPLQVPNAVCGP